MRVELKKPRIALFTNEYPTANVYGVDSVVYIKSLEDYLELSKRQDVMEHVYIAGNGTSDTESTGFEQVDLVKKGHLKYQVAGTEKRWTVFTVPQNVSTKHWRYNGKQPIRNLGFMPTFESSPGGREVVYSRFYHVYLPSYIISIIALAFMLGYYFFLGWRKATSIRSTVSVAITLTHISKMLRD